MSAADSGPPPQFGSPLAGDLTRFLQFQRAAGYRYREEADALRRLDRFLAIHLAPGDPVITRDLVRAYLARRGGESETTREHRLSRLRQFCRFLALREPRTAIPPPRCLGIRRRPFVARVLSRAEGRRFLQACAAYPGRPGFPLRGVVHGTALIPLYLTGLRVGEAVRLTVGDVDLPGAVLRIRDTKFGKTRLVPLAADLAARLGRCRDAVALALGPRSLDAPSLPAPPASPVPSTASATRFGEFSRRRASPVGAGTAARASMTSGTASPRSACSSGASRRRIRPPTSRSSRPTSATSA